MNNQSHILYLFTVRYPYGTGETFVEDELAYLASEFNKIYIFPLEGMNDPLKRNIPSNAHIVDWSAKFKYNGLLVLLKKPLLFIRLLLIESSSVPKATFKENFREFRSMLLQNIARAQCIKEYVKKEKDEMSVFYTFWFDDWATVLSILKDQGCIPSYYSRVHGYDLYVERRKNNWIPFRAFQMEMVKKIFAVSKDGYNYLKVHYPQYGHKFRLNHLGVKDQGLNPFFKQGQFTLVSCSNLISLKRVHLIIEILRKVDLNLKWIHFGDGPLYDELVAKSKELPSNINVNFMGQSSHQSIIDFYKTQTVNLFIHLSETEGGVSIALQEAASFGIPLLGTNAGGIPEIVTESTGALVQVNFEIDEVAQIINSFESSFRNTSEFRSGVKEFWQKNFNAEVNQKQFYQQLM